MLHRGKAKRVVVYLNESARWHGGSLYDAILTMLLSKRVAVANVVRGIAGENHGRSLATTSIADLASDLPVVIQAIDTADVIDQILPELYHMVDRGLITVEEIEIVKHALPETVAPPQPAKVTMNAKQLSIHISEKDTYRNEPLHEAILKRFNMEEFAGATVYRALEGFGAHHKIHHNRKLSLHRESPIVLLMVDTEENVRKALGILDGMLEHGAVVVSDVQVTYYGPSAIGKGEGRPASS